MLGDPGERVDASELALVHRSGLFLQLTLIMRLISVYGGLEEAVSRFCLEICYDRLRYAIYYVEWQETGSHVRKS